MTTRTLLLPTAQITATTAEMMPNQAYVTDHASLVTLTLPANGVSGNTMKVIGKGAGLWKIAQRSGQVIYFGNTSTTVGAAGYLSAVLARDCVYLFCLSNNEWQVECAVGNIQAY